MNDTLKILKIAKIALEDKKAEDINIIDIEKISDLTNYFVIATGNNPNQLRAIADEIEEKLFKNGFKLLHSEGYTNANWILLDYDTVIIHIFSREDREFYDIDRIWADGKKITDDDLINVLIN